MEKEKTLETLHNLAEQGYGDDTIWEVIDRLENKSEAEEQPLNAGEVFQNFCDALKASKQAAEEE